MGEKFFIHIFTTAGELDSDGLLEYLATSRTTPRLGLTSIGSFTGESLRMVTDQDTADQRWAKAGRENLFKFKSCQVRPTSGA